MGKSLAYRYVEEIHSQLKFWPAWFPYQEIELGAIGTFKNFEFQRHKHLRDYGISIEHRSGQTASKQYGSANSFSITAKTDVQVSNDLPAIPKGKFGMGIDFSSKWSVIFAASGLTQLEIGNLDEIGSALTKVHGWRPEWAVVTTVITADVTTVLIATSRDSAVEVASSLPLGATIAELANASAELKTMRSTHMAYDMIAEGPNTPLYRVDYLKRYGPGTVRPSEAPAPPVTRDQVSLQALTPAAAAGIYGGSDGEF